MNILRISAVALAVLAPVIANAQISQILGVIHSAQTAVTQTTQSQPQQDVAQQQAQQAQRPRIGYVKQPVPCDANCPLDPEDKAKYEAQQKRDTQQGQQQLDDARKIAGMCPVLTDGKFNMAERIIRCRNKGLTEEQQMTFVGGFPLLAQAYVASMVQDVYEDNVIDPGRGKAISDYYNGCYKQGAPCVRRKW
jgi:hypothetical protein